MVTKRLTALAKPKRENYSHIKDLRPDPENRRAHNPRNIGMVVDALHSVGAARSIVIDEEGQILAGNGTVEAMAEAGLTKVRVVDVDGSTLVAVRRTGLSAEQKRALAMFDNRTAELAEWNPEQLKLDSANGLDLRPWFSELEAAQLLGTQPKGGLTDPDAIPERRATDIQLGDFFELGTHRLVCGDCTVEPTMQRLLGSDAVDLVLTDPPFGIGVDYGAFVDSAENVRALIAAVMPLLQRFPVVLLTPGIAQMWTYPKPDWLLAWTHPAGMDSCPWGFNSVMPVLAYGADPYLKRQMGRRPTGITMATDRKGVEGHPTPKPIDVWEWLLERGSPVPQQIVYDPFGGSGTTLMACERLNRAARIMDLYPPFCQVIIDRWEAFTGQKAVKVGDAVPA